MCVVPSSLIWSGPVPSSREYSPRCSRITVGRTGSCLIIGMNRVLFWDAFCFECLPAVIEVSAAVSLRFVVAVVAGMACVVSFVAELCVCVSLSVCASFCVCVPSNTCRLDSPRDPPMTSATLQSFS